MSRLFIAVVLNNFCLELAKSACCFHIIYLLVLQHKKHVLMMYINAAKNSKTARSDTHANSCPKLLETAEEKKLENKL